MPPNRLAAPEYRALCDRLSAVMRVVCRETFGEGNYRFDIVPAYRNKPDFGDVDVVLSSNAQSTGSFKKALTGSIAEWISAKHIHVNDSVISFPFECFQVDVILAESINHQCTLAYLSYNDLGNLLGRTIHKLGVTYGHVGLKFIVRESLFTHNLDDNHIVDEIILTTDTNAILTLGGWDPLIWAAGFDELHQIFEYVATSPFFDAASFDLAALNHRNKVRDRKRATYSKFLDWISQTPGIQAREFKGLPKDTYRRYWECRFPFLANRLIELDRQLGERRLYRAKVNGEIAMRLLGIDDGKMVGQVLAKFRENTTIEEVLAISESEIADRLRDAFSSICGADSAIGG